MGVLTWGPLSSGLLSGRVSDHRRSGLEPHRFDSSAPANAPVFDAVDALKTLATDAGIPLAHLAVAYVRAHPAVTSVIIGPRTMEQLNDLLAAAETTLDDDLLDRIDEVVPPGVDLLSDGNYAVAHPALVEPGLRRRSPDGLLDLAR